jgi:hypothetical protein
MGCLWLFDFVDPWPAKLQPVREVSAAGPNGSLILNRWV